MKPVPASTITRTPGKLALEGVRAATLEALMASLQPLAEVSSWVAADLSLGAWRSHQAASELGNQLGLELGPTARPADTRSAIAGESGHAHVIGAGIDAETRGDRAAIDALDH